ncbi:MAG: SEC-C domain-containing protein [Egibacteraceae bacterium]
MSQLYAGAGLETFGPWVGLIGEDWSRLDEEIEDAVAALWRQVWGLGESEGKALGILVVACELASSIGAEELAAHLKTVEILGHMLSLEGVAEAFVGSMLGRGPEQEPAVAAFTQALVAAGGGSAGAHYVLSLCAEHRGDVAAGEAHLAAALAVDPDFEPALLDAAWYAEDRGDAARALGYLRAIGIDADDEHTLLLQRFAARGPAAARRNEACPCGSGRKYKVCCSRRNGHPLTERAGWLQRKAGAFLRRPAQRFVLRDIALAHAARGLTTGSAWRCTIRSRRTWRCSTPTCSPRSWTSAAGSCPPTSLSSAGRGSAWPAASTR